MNAPGNPRRCACGCNIVLPVRFKIVRNQRGKTYRYRRRNRYINGHSGCSGWSSNTGGESVRSRRAKARRSAITKEAHRSAIKQIDTALGR